MYNPPVILPLSLALKAASGILLEFQALSSLRSTQIPEGFGAVGGLSLKPGGTHRAEATWWKSMNFRRPLTPRSTSAPALSWPQQGSSRGTSSRKGARARCSAGGWNLPKGEVARPGSRPSLPPAPYRLEFSRLMTCSSAENGLKGSRPAVITARGETHSVCVCVCGCQSRS